MPLLSAEQKEELEALAWGIVEAREDFAGRTIGSLYGDDMPQALLQAHQKVDAALERFCVGRDFRNDRERLEYLFKQYVVMSKKEKEKRYRCDRRL
ncbi:type IIL restriction-modification enzyme MmeI [Cupriavidus basilensis]